MLSAGVKTPLMRIKVSMKKKAMKHHLLLGI